VIDDALDLAGDDTIAGIYRGAADVGGEPFGPSVNFNSYVARYDRSGAHVWSIPLESPNLAFVRGCTVNGSAYTAAAGSFDPSMLVGGQELTTAGAGDVFYLRLDQDGGIATFVRFGGAGNDTGMGALFDGLGGVYLVGVTDGAIDFGGGIAAESRGGLDLFVVHLSEQGVPMWAMTAGGPDAMSELVYSAVAPDGDLVLSGAFQGTMTFPELDPLESQGATDIFLARISPTGAARWAKRFGGLGNDSSRAVAVGSTGQIGLTGEFAGTASFGGLDHTSRGFIDFFAAVYEPDGDLVWSRSAGSAGDDRGLGIALDSTGAAFATLAFHDRIELGGEPIDATGDDWSGALVKYGP
jgi:hypothetical protein